MNKFAISLLLLVAIGLSGIACASENEDDGNSATEKMLSKSWWNQTRMVETLALKKSQRDKIDALAISYIQQKKEFQVKSKNLQESFIGALKQQDFDQAKDIVQDLTNHSVIGARIQRMLKVEVLQILEQPQRDLLVAEFPQIISRAWLSSSRSR